MAATRILPDLELLNRLFLYDPETGVLTWRPRDRSEFSATKSWNFWNARFAGKAAGTKRADGRIFIAYGQQKMVGARVVYKMHFGVEPASEIDHVNGDPSDNRIANLRPATHAENMRNSRRRSSNKCGYKGVFWNTERNKYQASIRVNNIQLNLGLFDCPKAAHAAYVAAAKQHHGEFARTA